ncbi:MAG TPA: FAD-dependent thymidylate synthase [Caulobacteraceae bacterium]|jgi:thymidylate synthase ThyX
MRVLIHDDLPPEASAMLQALYSRSAESVTTHLEKVRERGPDNFMASYYVGYGHASIGDCGYTTIFAEDISLLACKAIQDNPLYSGQETSTRYIDFSSRKLVDPVGTSESEAVLDRWMEFYARAEPRLRGALAERLTRPAPASQATWEKALAARTFDVLRGFLPAGVTSQTAWTTSLRQAHEHGIRLAAHPLAEVRAVGEGCLSALRQRYPQSFGHQVSEQEQAYLAAVAAHETYMPPPGAAEAGVFEMDSDIDALVLQREAGELLRSRPRKCLLPRTLGRYGRYRCVFDLDFGSFRDLQRHRGGLCPMPLLTDQLGLHPWYLDQLPPDLRLEAELLLKQQKAAVAQLARQGVSEPDLQYFQPLGMLVRVELHYDLPQVVYVAELRSGKTVHPTLREAALRIGRRLRAAHAGLALYLDESLDQLDWRRGNQDIIDRYAPERSAA